MSEKSYEEAMGYVPYVFAYTDCECLVLKAPDEIIRLNALQHAISPESDYPNYRWYIPDDQAQTLGHQRARILREVAWFVGLPFYTLELEDGSFIEVAEFYVEKCVQCD